MNEYMYQLNNQAHTDAENTELRNYVTFTRFNIFLTDQLYIHTQIHTLIHTNALLRQWYRMNYNKRMWKKTKEEFKRK